MLGMETHARAGLEVASKNIDVSGTHQNKVVQSRTQTIRSCLDSLEARAKHRQTLVLFVAPSQTSEPSTVVRWHSHKFWHMAPSDRAPNKLHSKYLAIYGPSVTVETKCKRKTGWHVNAKASAAHPDIR